MKYLLVLEKVAVTFVEAALAYYLLAPHPGFNKTALAGAVGAGVSAVYNLLRSPLLAPPVQPPLPPKPGV